MKSSSMESEIKVGEIVEAVVSRVTDFGAFVKINDRWQGLIHISKISERFVKNVGEHLKVGDKVKAKVIKIGPGNKIDLTLRMDEKKGSLPPRHRSANPNASSSRGEAAGKLARHPSGFRSSDFEEKLKNFLRQ